MKYWLVKTEPEAYAFEDLVAKGEDIWDGVKNHQARIFLNEMNLGDEVFVYHSGKQRAIMGMAVVSKTAFPDPGIAEEEGWVAVKLAFLSKLTHPVTLKEIKLNPALNNMFLVRQSRLSVMPVREEEAEIILTLSKV